jgi:HSP20 family protein
MSTQLHWQRGPLADVFDWLDWPLMALRPASGHSMRAEDLHENGRYVLRVEVPGVDPEHDIDLMVSGGNVTVKAERRHDDERRHHSEFRYGKFERSFALPSNADERQVQAIYSHGILEITVGLRKTAADRDAPRHISVMVDHHIQPT